MRLQLRQVPRATSRLGEHSLGFQHLSVLNVSLPMSPFFYM